MGYDNRPLQIERPSRPAPPPSALGAGAAAAAADPLRSLVMHAVRDNPRPLSPKRITIAFGARAPYKFTEHLSSDDVGVLCETLQKLERFFMGHPKNVCSSVEAGIVEALTRLLEHRDEQVRTRTAYILSLVAVVPNGKAAIISCNTVPKLLALLPDHAAEVRANAVDALHAACVFGDSVPMNIIACGGVELIVRDVQHSAHPGLLETLFFLVGIDAGRTAALECDGVEVATSLMSPEHTPRVLELAAKNLQRLCVPFEAKKRALEAGSVGAVVELLVHADEGVRQSACAALMSIAADIDAKKAALEAGAASAVIDLLNENNQDVQLVAIKCISVLAEGGRSFFHPAIARLGLIVERTDDDLLRQSALIAADVIKWEP